MIAAAVSCATALIWVLSYQFIRFVRLVVTFIIESKESNISLDAEKNGELQKIWKNSKKFGKTLKRWRNSKKFGETLKKIGETQKKLEKLKKMEKL